MASHAYSTTASIAGAYRPTLLRTRRRALEDWIESAIALLDSLDPDPDLEAPDDLLVGHESDDDDGEDWR
jgi:phage terminase large subunit-like protein